MKSIDGLSLQVQFILILPLLAMPTSRLPAIELNKGPVENVILVYFTHKLLCFAELGPGI